MIKDKKTYYFSVEGQTEKLYLKHLEFLINEKIEGEIIFDILVSPTPQKRVKSLPDGGTIVYHFCDLESDGNEHRKTFLALLDSLNQAKKNPKVKDYRLAYSNLTFELWILLHKVDQFGPISHRKNYIKLLNSAFGTKLRGMQEFKREEHLKKLFKKLTLEDVKAAIRREEQIEANNKNAGYEPTRYKGFSFYRINPSSNVGKIIKEILAENNLL